MFPCKGHKKPQQALEYIMLDSPNIHDLPRNSDHSSYEYRSRALSLSERKQQYACAREACWLYGVETYNNEMDY